MEKTRAVKIVPSIFSANLAFLAIAVQQLEDAKADAIHLDIEDGVFIPNITFGPKLVRCLRPLSSLPFDVHLEIMDPEKCVADFVEAGANTITVHAEACPFLHRTIRYIKSFGVKAGVAFNAASSLEPLHSVEDDIDLVLVMTADADRTSPPFIPSMVRKVGEASEWLAGRGVEIEADGGLTPDNVGDVVRAGATMIVSGRAIWERGDVASAVARFREALELAM
jgi:ribulose-phosphate 3-epimerase